MGLGLWLCLATTVTAQKSNNNPNQEKRDTSLALKTGDLLPKDFILHGLINKPGQLQLNQQYQGQKLLLISFWSTTCVPCIREINLLDSLKRIHPRAFNALMVSAEPRTKVEQFLQRQGLTNTPLHFLSDNRQLDPYFPHRYLPHTIWISPEGKVSAITGADSITEHNLLNFNDQNAKNYQTKTDDLDFNPSQPLELPKDKILYRSTISGKIAAGNAGVVGGPVRGMAQRFFTWNSSISYLYYNAYSLFSGFPGLWRNSLIEVHTTDSLRLFYPTRQRAHLLQGSKYSDLAQWEQENSYCYELRLPNKIPMEQFRKYVFDDLEKAFGIRATIKEKTIRCNVVSLKAKHQLSPAKPKEGASIQWNQQILECRNVNFRDLFSWIFAKYDPETLPDPFLLRTLSEAQQAMRFDLDLQFSISNKRPPLQTLFDSLERQGILVQSRLRPYPILILDDLNTSGAKP